MALLNNTPQEYYNGNNYGNYQFISLQELIAQFEVAYVGENKIIPKINRLDIQFHAMRALQEFSFDTFKSIKAQEIVVPATLQMILPQDYVGYTKISSVDSSGIKHLLYPTSKTSNPKKYQIDSNNEFLFDSNGQRILSGNLLKNGSFNGDNHWILNETGTGDSTAASQLTTVTANALGIDEPQTGWFYGFDGYSIRGYNLNQYQAFRQDNISILPGEQYTITFTISDYTSGAFNFVIANELGGIVSGTNRSADGTYEETVTAPTTGNTAGGIEYIPNQIWIRNTSATAGNAKIDNISIVRVGGEDDDSTTWNNYKSHKPSENSINEYQDYENNVYWPNEGERYGIDPQHAQANGSFYIDELAGKIHFSSNISGNTVILDYISDGLGTQEEMQVHKFAEEAMYKHIAYAILSTSSLPIHQQLAPRFKKEKFAATRQAKLRLSNIKLEELTQILRGKSKHIKH